VEGEVLSLDTPISKAISVAAFFGLTLSPADTPRQEGAPLVALGPSVGIAAATERESTGESIRDSKAKSPEPATPKLVTAPTTNGVCTSGMALVEGDYCPDADQVCLKWLDPPPYQNLRCGEYAKPATCKGPRQHRRFCVDREEYVDTADAGADPNALPLVGKSWNEAQTICEGRGARLCRETEWEFACEGPEMNPYPYGFKREAGACNIDRTDLGGMNEKLTDHRAPLTAFPQCTSPFGAHDMTGNVDEWVEREGGATAPHRSALRGGWWLPGRNRCRAATLGHDESYTAKQVGFRCCSDAR
jgi:sulfatase modifying factor 1